MFKFAVILTSLSLSSSAIANGETLSSLLKSAQSQMNAVAECLKTHPNNLPSCSEKSEGLVQSTARLRNQIQANDPTISQVLNKMATVENFDFTKMESINPNYQIRFRVYFNEDYRAMLQVYARGSWETEYKLAGEQEIVLTKSLSGIYTMLYSATYFWSEFRMIFDPSQPDQIKFIWKQDVGTEQTFRL